ncbi:hypothetical protein PIB30_050540 [Stylosanthes scabra]|uniref:Uncharacterized protein n=1 Tax=Stylosanthes scabra TaxID=79078 RepID=A0ABU6WIP0_9FABA|nr:hypothetical protein [Stylosanthes scabra]
MIWAHSGDGYYKVQVFCPFHPQRLTYFTMYMRLSSPLPHLDLSRSVKQASPPRPIPPHQKSALRRAGPPRPAYYSGLEISPAPHNDRLAGWRAKPV